MTDRPRLVAVPDTDDDADEVALGENDQDKQPGVISTELVDVRGAIDPPAHKPTWEQWTPWDARSRRLIRPVWAQSWANFRAWMVINLREAGYIVTWHTTRTPIYGWRVIRDEVRGAWRVTCKFFRWLYYSEGRAMSLLAADSDDDKGFHRSEKVWREVVHRRVVGALVVAVVLAGALTAAYYLAPWWMLPLLLAGALAIVGGIGHDKGQPLVDDYYIDKGAKTVKLTSAQIMRAFGGLGVAAINKALDADPKGGIRFRGPIEREGKVGFVFVVELPNGVTAAEVIEKRAKYAAGMGRPLGCVWPEQVKGEHPGVLRTFVADKDINKTEQPPWPLTKEGQVDLFRPIPFGTDQQGKPVWLTLMFACGVVGAVPRVGKTNALRLLLLAAALDPRCDVYAFDKKGSGDFGPIKKVAYALTEGDDDEEIAQDIAYMRALHSEMRARYKVLRKMPQARAPESKVTPELASDPALPFHPIFGAVDECQLWYEHKEYGKEFEEIVTDLHKRGPAVGIMFWEATQRVDAHSIPTGIRDNAVFRFCLKVTSWKANNDCLGSGMYAAGATATIFSFDDKGIGYLVGDGADPRIVRTYEISTAKAGPIADRARAIRERAGTLRGYCIGEEGPQVFHSLIEDLPRVFVTSERLHSDDVIERLQEVRPGTYDGWKKETLATAVRDQLGVSTTQVRIGKKVAAGLHRSEVLEAAALALDRRTALPPAEGSEVVSDA